jgi:outer membrane protein assembly factor BamD (BamD/ComL family)
MRRSSTVVRAAARFSLAASLLAGVACHPAFQPRNYASSALLYKASIAEYKLKHWDNAVTGFERLTLDLSARDSLLPLSHWYLAHAHAMRNEHLLAATSYARLAESFGDDSLAPMALLYSGYEYAALWRRPDLDATYGDLAQVQFRQFDAIYPDNLLKRQADSASLAIDEKKAQKDFGIGMHYVLRHAYESSLIYFKDVVKNYPNAKTARDALMEMVTVYRRPELKYLPEARETCVTLRTAYAGDAQVAALCPNAVPADSARPPAKQPAKPPVKKPAQ